MYRGRASQTGELLHAQYASPSHPPQRSYAEANNGFYEGPNVREKGTSLSRDDRVHGSMLIINELIMNCAWSDEVSEGVVMGCGIVNAVCSSEMCETE